VSGADFEDRAGESEDEAEGIGFFPSWGWVYGSIIVYTVLAIALLHFFTVTFDHGLP
jgi:hypothetical protein